MFDVVTTITGLGVITFMLLLIITIIVDAYYWVRNRVSKNRRLERKIITRVYRKNKNALHQLINRGIDVYLSVKESNSRDSNNFNLVVKTVRYKFKLGVKTNEGVSNVKKIPLDEEGVSISTKAVSDEFHTCITELIDKHNTLVAGVTVVDYIKEYKKLIKVHVGFVIADIILVVSLVLTGGLESLDSTILLVALIFTIINWFIKRAHRGYKVKVG